MQLNVRDTTETWERGGPGRDSTRLDDTIPMEALGETFV
jgi:hypothetical protein